MAFVLTATGVPTSNKEGTVICEIDGWVLGGVQFGVLFEVLVMARGYFCKTDDRVLGHAAWIGVLAQDLCWGAW